MTGMNNAIQIAASPAQTTGPGTNCVNDDS
jgi:hypothetical protein